MKKWQLLTEIRAVINESLKIVWLFPQDKSTNKLVKNLISFWNEGSVRQELIEKSINNNEFEVRFVDGKVLVGSPELNNDFYHLKNYDDSLLLETISCCNTISHGRIETTFEVGISCNEVTDKVVLLCEDMPSYHTAFNEMIRRASVSSSKKTKKRIPGHRYDSENSTVFILCELNSAIFDNNTYTDFKPSEDNVAYLYTKDIKECTKVSEVLRKQSFESGDSSIHIVLAKDKLPSMVDYGQALENDVENYSDYLEDLVKNGKTLKQKLLPLCFMGGDEVSNIQGKLPNSIIDTIRDQIKEEMLKCYLTYNTKVNCEVGEDNRKQSLETLLWSEVDPTMLNSREFYHTLCDYYCIELNSILNETLKFDVLALEKDFELYKKYSSHYYKSCQSHSCIIINRPESEKRPLFKSKITTSLKDDLTISNEYLNLIHKFILFVDSTGNVTKSVPVLDKFNYGTRNHPKYFKQMIFNTPDLIKWAEEENLLTDSLKLSITTSYLYNYYLEYEDINQIIPY